MNKHTQLTLYETDYALWCAEQGELLRSGHLERLDRKHLAEEIESLGRSDRYEIENRLEVLILHLLKWAFQPGKRKAGWRATVIEQRSRISKRVSESPSLRNYPSEVLEDAYRLAHARAEDETGLSFDTFPDECPFTIEQILDPDWFPEKAERH